MNLIERAIEYVIATELYPKIFVYSNIFEDPEKLYDIIKRSGKNDNEIFETWKEWYTFGEIIQNVAAVSETINFDRTVDYPKLLKCIDIESEINADQKYLLEELVRGFHLVNKDYLQKNNFNLDLSTMLTPTEPSDTPDFHKKFPESVNKYLWDGPSICKYFAGGRSDLRDLAMQFHSDHIAEKNPSEGYKFFLTTTTYLNDDYEGGEIVFAIGDKTIEYKPKIGDIIVFPSGHPNHLTENNNSYFHAVKKVYGADKYFCRMYWKVFEHGSKEFFENKKNLTEEEIRVIEKEYNQKLYYEIQEKYESISGLYAIGIDEETYPK